ncbi:SWIM zinc finger family protein, partial [Streptomyces asiaticus]|uniref:SWIM zinc finger family protein n=1 Tax=Streptomyces asiaticus TaxID=114695 RepID=UPI003CD08F64
MRGLTEANLKMLAGPRSYERGLGYLDAVSGVEVGDGWVTASVHGTERYEVELTLDGPGGLSVPKRSERMRCLRAGPCQFCWDDSEAGRPSG